MGIFERSNSWLDELLSKESNKTSSSKWLTLGKEEGSELFFRMLPLNESTSIVEKKHWGIDKSPLLCMSMFGEKCPVCDLLWEARKKHNIDILKYLPSKSFIISVVELKFNGSTFEVIPIHKFLRVSNEFMEWYRDNAVSPFKPIIFDDVKKGVIIQFKRKANNRISKNIISEYDLSPYIQDIEDTFTDVRDVFKKPDSEVIDKYIKVTKDKILYLLSKSGINNEESTVSEDLSNDNNIKDNTEIIRELIKTVGIDVPEDLFECIGMKFDSIDKCKTCDYRIVCNEIAKLLSK